MLVIGEKLNSSIPSAYAAMQGDDEGIIKLIKLQAEAGASYLDVNTALFLTKLHNVSDIFGRSHYVRTNNRLTDLLDLLGLGHVRGVIKIKTCTIHLGNFINYAGRSCNKQEIKLSLKSFLYNFHMKKA